MRVSDPKDIDDGRVDDGNDPDAMENIPVPQEREAEEQVAEPEAAAKETAALSAAHVLDTLMIATPSLSIANAALQLQVSAKVLSKRLDAVAEAIARVPGETLAAVLRYIEQMLGTRLEAVACLERQAFDSTPTDMRIPGEDSCQKEQRVKLYVVDCT